MILNQVWRALTHRTIHDSTRSRPKAHTFCGTDDHTTLLCERSQYSAAFERNSAVVLREGTAGKVFHETCPRVEARTGWSFRVLEVVL